MNAQRNQILLGSRELREVTGVKRRQIGFVFQDHRHVQRLLKISGNVDISRRQKWGIQDPILIDNPVDSDGHPHQAMARLRDRLPLVG